MASITKNLSMNRETTFCDFCSKFKRCNRQGKGFRISCSDLEIWKDGRVYFAGNHYRLRGLSGDAKGHCGGSAASVAKS